MASNRQSSVSAPYGAVPTVQDLIEILGHAAGPHREDQIEVGYQAFTSDRSEEFGAVRAVYPDGLVVYVENAGDFRIPLAAVEAVHFQKVIVNCGKLSRSLRRAIGHAHDAEVPGA